jgi:hypothetical protein
MGELMYISTRVINKMRKKEWGVKNVKLSLQQAMKAHRVVRRRGSHIF